MFSSWRWIQTVAVTVGSLLLSQGRKIFYRTLRPWWRRPRRDLTLKWILHKQEKLATTEIFREQQHRPMTCADNAIQFPTSFHNTAVRFGLFPHNSDPKIVCSFRHFQLWNLVWNYIDNNITQKLSQCPITRSWMSLCGLKVKMYLVLSLAINGSLPFPPSARFK